jgi:hypothetical protein
MSEFIKIKKGLDILLENYFNSTDKKEASVLFSELKENKDLQILYYAASNLQNPPKLDDNDIEDFITENVNLCKEINRGSLEKYLTKLNGVNLSPLEKSINTVLFEERNALNFTEYNSSKKMIAENIKKKSINPEQILEGYSSEEVLLAKEYAKNPSQVLKNLCNECIEVLDGKLKEDLDTDTKLLIYQTKERLYEAQINSKTDPKSVIELLTLKKNLLSD